MPKKDELIEVVTVVRKSELEQISNLGIGEGLSFYHRVLYWFLTTKPDRGIPVRSVKVDDDGVLVITTENGDLRFLP